MFPVSGREYIQLVPSRRSAVSNAYHYTQAVAEMEEMQAKDRRAHMSMFALHIAATSILARALEGRHGTSTCRACRTTAAPTPSATRRSAHARRCRTPDTLPSARMRGRSALSACSCVASMRSLSPKRLRPTRTVSRGEESDAAVNLSATQGAAQPRPSPLLGHSSGTNPLNKQRGQCARRPRRLRTLEQDPAPLLRRRFTIHRARLRLKR